jgi:drug/metabolite transporter (DMT)-like permease
MQPKKMQRLPARPRPSVTYTNKQVRPAQLRARPAMIKQPLRPVSTDTRRSIAPPPKLEDVQTPPDTVTIPKKLRVLFIVLGVGGIGGLLIESLVSGNKSQTWLALICMNIVGTVGFNLVLRRSSLKHADPWFTAAVMGTGLALPFLLKEIVAPIHFPHFVPFDFFLLGVATMACVSLQICNVKALQYLEASVFSVIYNSRILFATLFGFVFLSESVGTWALIGGLLIFLAVFVVRQKSSQNVTKHGILYALGAAVSISLMNTCEKRLIQLVGYEQYIFPMLGMGAIIIWIIVLTRGTKTSFGVLVRPQSLLLMVLRACAGIGFSYALVFGPVAVSSYLSSLSVVLLVILGMLFLGERDYIKAKLSATGMAIVGLTCILIDGLS